MTIKLTTVGAAIALALGSATAGAADFGDMFSFRGFGTLGIVHSSENQADFVGSVFQPDGAGYTNDWDLRPDTLLGGQVNAKFSDKFSAVVQAVSQHQYDKTFTPYIEWANIKYQVTQDFAVRAGRIVLPGFLISESRFVGFANPWVRPPLEVYVLSSITNSDGADAVYSFTTGSVKNAVQAHWGKSKPKLPSGTIDANSIWGINYAVEFGDAKLRAGYVSDDLDLQLAGLDPLISGLNSLAGALRASGFSTAAAQADSMYRKYRVDETKLSILTLGASYDPGKYFVMAEGAIFNGDSILSDAKTAYVTGGYRIKAFTPYATLATLQSDRIVEPGISTTGLPGPLAAGAAGLNGGLNAALASTRASQRTAAVGLRWDFMSSADLKVQYDRIKLDDNTHGRLSNVQPGFVPGDVDLISISVDFIF